MSDEAKENEIVRNPDLDVCVTKHDTCHTSQPPPSSAISLKETEWLDPRKSMKKVVLRYGQGLKCPREESECVIVASQKSGPHLEFAVKSDFKLNKTSKLVIGECDSAIGRLVEQLLQTMKSREKCEVLMFVRRNELLEQPKSEACQQNFIETVLDELTEFTFLLELESFEERPDINQLDENAKLRRAALHKEKGVQLFKQGLVRSAFYRFSKATKLLLLGNEQRLPDEEGQRRNALILACYLNMAACQLDTGLYNHVISNCNKVLDLDSKNSKAYYRRGLANFHLQNLENSRNDFKQLLSIDPQNFAAKRQLQIINTKLKLETQYCASQMKKMFS